MKTGLIATCAVLVSFGLGYALIAGISIARAQSLQSGNIGGMPYVLLPAANGCSSGCSMVTLLSFMGETPDQTASDIQKIGSAAFQAANPNTVIVAPMIRAAQSDTVNYGGYKTLTTDQQKQMVGVVQAVQAQNNVDTTKSAVIGGSLGGTGVLAALATYGPKGVVQPGVFSSGVSFDASAWALAGNSAATQALCGVPIMAVHGTNDTNQSISYDQGLASALSSCGSFKLVPIQGAGHGTWNAGYSAGVGAGTPLGWVTSEISGANSGSTVTASATSPAAPTASSTATTSQPDATQDATAIQSATITPGAGSITDADGNEWVIAPNGSIRKGDVWVAGGGGTSQLQIGSDGKVYGLDSHGRGWFLLSGDQQSWASTPPPSNLTTTDTTQQASATAAPTITQAVACTGGTGPNATGRFYVANGQIIGPNGQPFIARGINIGWTRMGEVNNVLTTFPGINMIRLPVGTLNISPDAFRSFVNTATSQGIVVEIEYHPWPIPNAPSGAALAAEVQFVTSIAKAFASNPYVWIGTQNEPQGGDVSGEHLALYNAIRGAGNNNPLMMMLIGGGNPGTLGIGRGLNASAYSSMKNVVWDYHQYNWSTGFSTDQAKIEAYIASSVSLIQQITSADGVVPVIIGEYGNGVIESKVDPGGTQTVAAVINVGATGKWGSLAWIWQSNGIALNLINSDNTPSTPYGQMVALYIGKDRQLCTPNETATNAQSTVAQITTQVAETKPDPTVAAADAAIANADATPTAVTANSGAADALLQQVLEVTKQ